jgi:xylulose-5-phosphate/fructose-6-phosphate phosphoketolase
MRTKNYINVLIASKHPSRQWLTMEQAKKHCAAGIGIFDFISNDNGKPDVVMASCGDVPTLESIAAATILRKNFPKLKVRVVNIVDLMKLQSNTHHPHGLTDEEFDKFFPQGVPVIFTFHGYPSLIHQLVYKRKQDDDFHVHGYVEEGTITTAFDMRVQNHIDRFHIVLDALRYLNIKG